MPTRPVLVTGASGYVGSRLVRALEGSRVRVLTHRSTSDGADAVQGDIRDPDVAARALDGIGVAYYLVHSLGGEDFGDADRAAAATFAQAASDADVERIVYLGGIGRGDLSPHLASRQEVGRILAESGVPTVELRASVVIGRGSASYDTFALLAKAPVVMLPDWVETPSQPIAIDDVVAYLLEARYAEPGVYEIGGADRVPYRSILEQLGTTVATLPAPAALAGLPALLKPLQPERMRVVSDLVESLRYDTSVADDAAARAFNVKPKGLAAAIAAAR